jgi:signal transduction histidine kinase
LTNALPLRDDNGVIIKWYGSCIDIHDRKEAEEELRRRQDLLTAAERISMTGSFAWDITADEIVYSDQLRRIYEFEEGAEIPRPILSDWLHAEDLPLVVGEIGDAAVGRDNREADSRLAMPDGRLKYVRRTAHVVRHDDGRSECIGVVQDITRRRMAEEALEKVRSELAHVARVTSLGELTASIAHEVNQPLSGIITNANTCLRMLSADPPDIGGALKTAERTIRDGGRASEVIRRLRGLFRKEDYVPEPVNLNEAAQEVVALCAHDLQRRRIPVIVDLAEDLPVVEGDRVQLQQVMLNLVLNAADAMDGVRDRPRQIRIETSRASETLAQFTVRDVGSGIAADEANRIFDAFYTTKPNGTGIGLSVSRSIIERHNGKLWAEDNEGPGSSFSFSLACGEPASVIAANSGHQ